MSVSLCSSINTSVYPPPLKNLPKKGFSFGLGGIGGTLGVSRGTPGASGGTLEVPGVTQRVPWRYLGISPRRSNKVIKFIVYFFLYWCFFPHRLIYLVSPICAIFKASALWSDAFYKSKCLSVCLFVRLWIRDLWSKGVSLILAYF